MPSPSHTRRNFLRQAALLTIGTSTLAQMLPAAADSPPVPFSSGTDTPSFRLPADACDCHMHIYDSRFPAAPTAKLRPPPATVDMYRLLQRRLGTSRNVVVTPSTYGTDNRCTLDALLQFGPTARGIAVADDSISDAELKRLDRAGVRGLRFNLAVGSVTTVDMIEPLARRIEPYGWHVQINMPVEELQRHRPMLARLPVPAVFDHFGRIPLPAGTAHPAFGLIRDLMQQGRAYIKLSGAYLASKAGAPAYADVAPLARALIQAAPDQVIWGSDWPHPTEASKPDDAALLSLLPEWAGSEPLLSRILITNPARLYRF
jgi:predicted TIM-barrel fold metal-dependent hydrolase